MTELWQFIPSENSVMEEPVYSELTAELYGSSWYSRLSSAEIDYYRSYIQDGTTLELGCGTGRLLIPVFQAGCDIYGMDISAPMLERLKEKLPPDQRHRVIQWSILKVPYPIDDESLDYITVPFSSFSLMHDGYVERVDENTAFSEFYRILRPGGLLIINDARTYVHNKTGGSAAIAQQELDGKEDKDMEGCVKDNMLILTFKQQHPKHGEIKEEWISKFSLKETRIIPQLVIREREIVFTRVSDGKVLERQSETIPVWDVEDYPKLGKDAGFEYLKGEETPDFHVSATVNHIFKKPL